MIARYLGGRSTTRYNKVYTAFRGVDFSVPPGEVDAQHSPDAVNVMIDHDGRLTKRPGYRVLKECATIYGLHAYRDELIVHDASGFWRYPDNTPLMQWPIPVNAAPHSVSVVVNNTLWILTGSGYFYYDGEKMGRVSEIAHVPTVAIACDPVTGGGTTLEAVNLLTDKRKIRYIGNGETTIYCVPEGYSYIDSITVNGEITLDYTEADKTHVSFAEAPGVPAVTGQDNVEITYVKYAEDPYFIDRCRYIGTYGLGGADSDRIFFTGDPKHPNADWHCDISAPKYAVDPTYIPDTSFALLGSDSSAIMGYRRLGNYQVILKEQSAQDSTAYLRSYGLDDKGEAYFSVREGASGIGCVNPYTLANLGDEPLFLSAYDGVCAVTNSYVTQVTSIQNRSWLVDAKLKKEALKNAFSVEWQDKYLIFCNSKVFVLDSRQNKTYRERSNSSYVYEAFLWEGIYASCAVEVNGDLYLALGFSSLAKLNTDLDGEAMYQDYYSTYGGERKAIEAYWTTPLDDDNYPTRRKSIGSHWLAFQTNGDIGDLELFYRTELSGEWKPLREVSCDREFDFYCVDFASFDFAAAQPLGDVPYHGKIKNYMRVQFKAQNTADGQSLPLAGIMKSFTYGDQNKVK